jgi:hypothetical protein
VEAVANSAFVDIGDEYATEQLAELLLERAFYWEQLSTTG